MIQRKQTLHLLIVVGLLVSMLFFDLATFTTGSTGTTEVVADQTDGSITKSTFREQDTVTLNVWGVYQNGEKLTLLTYFSILMILAIVVAVVTIFLYRRRWVQVRMCLGLGILVLGILLYVILYTHRWSGMLPGYAVKYSVVDLFPLFAIGFTYMAYRGIAKDIVLLRSVDRIR